MALINLKCNNCGGSIQMDDNQVNGFCMYCGNKFLVKDELVRIAVEHTGTVEVNRKQEADNYVKRAEEQFELYSFVIQQTLDKLNSINSSNKPFYYQEAEKIFNTSEIVLKVYKDKVDEYLSKAFDIDYQHSGAMELRLKMGKLWQAEYYPKYRLLLDYKLKSANNEVERNRRTDKGCLIVVLSIVGVVFLLYLIIRFFPLPSTSTHTTWATTTASSSAK